MQGEENMMTQKQRAESISKYMKLSKKDLAILLTDMKYTLDIVTNMRQRPKAEIIEILLRKKNKNQ